ncbi:sigma-70 family RNA polymerase sigma factor [Geobacillus stearothermophilus]|uniref:sigma-70 family RNA polymerase sigma factor n=1 Tax=Geobacillus stearothermophilus TaxID=1422 RepID=UPI000518B31A|nr:sigma-70 family RNA polymerase sigma factor [Geobacillus stearothermophilus]MED3843749.1 sigma-70 family RNA polymerase sigma factor [Geobacillus stearothermophilus]MED4332556.1 sigma-70 family RNA polymerase sigma factor [Geobacillus stearothermophilus]MED4355735.1 sigma-70 family RNA polymerase sigma factor [Geobacillus stearothermophilus]MED4996457.1 sigma-70 family RNA polymerase sigma factor [Geobacillus stearothermophilus]
MTVYPPPLSKSKLDALISAYQQTKTEEAATALLVRFEPLIAAAAKKMARSRPDFYEDLFQVGRLSFLRLLDHYDPNQGTNFESYAMKSLIGYMKNYLRDKAWYIQVPRRVKEKGSKVQQAIDELTVKLERSPNIDEIAAHLGLSVEETIEILAGRDHYQAISLDAPVQDGEKDATTIGEFVADEANEIESLIERMDLEQAIGKLSEQEQIVIDAVFRRGETQRSLAERLGVSQMTISRIQKRAIEKLKRQLTAAYPS